MKLPHMTPCDRSLFIFDDDKQVVGMIIEEHRPAVILACNLHDEMERMLRDFVILNANLHHHTPGGRLLERAKSLLAKTEVE